VTRARRIEHEFIEFIPDELAPNTLYISMAYATAIHLCVCGCGHRVVTPFSPTDWRLIFDGDTVSLDPSVGNWSFPCRSHYVLKRNQVVWADDWSPKMIAAGRARDRHAKAKYLGADMGKPATVPVQPGVRRRIPLWWLPRWLRRSER
jgi:hypothetical protein